MVADEKERGRVLSAFALQLTGDELEFGLWIALSITHEWTKMKLLTLLYYKLTQEHEYDVLEKALQVAMFLWQPKDAVEVMTKLATHLSLEQRAIMTERVLHATLELLDRKKQSASLITLAPLLTENLVKLALQTALELPDRHERERVLAALAPKFVGNLLTWGIQVAQALPDEKRQAEVFIALAAQLPEGVLEQHMKVLQTFSDEENT
ncbi:hypothetical protein KDW_39330 [Dictyobacter vulcani]|uniref:Uncharacterized protein n=1 Tax=Dictyobacter vulcani TaxID=2607529 RepID=A0A5J4KTH2_9CHLR|nr:hypothetical protein [Dictyobacter vulcani]GER89771.1 hypothetical protein KDW_39330 [Dictyobacter vulcani]